MERHDGREVMPREALGGVRGRRATDENVARLWLRLCCFKDCDSYTDLILFSTRYGFQGVTWRGRVDGKGVNQSAEEIVDDGPRRRLRRRA